MSIRVKLTLNAIALTTFFLVIVIVLQFQSRTIDEATNYGEFANGIFVSVSEMNSITFDYLLSPSPRARQQWEMKYGLLGRLINTAKFGTKESRVIIDRLKKNHEALSAFMRTIVENNRRTKDSNAVQRKLLADDSDRNVTQLMALSQLMMGDANELARISYTAIYIAKSWAFSIVLAVILISMAFACIISYLLSRGITTAINEVKSGTQRIAAGDLKHRLPLKGKDEIAQLSAAFNEMTEKLARSYAGLEEEMRKEECARKELQAAHEELENRVAARTEELMHSQERISSILSSITDCYFALDAQWRVVDVNDQALNFFGLRREQLIGFKIRDFYTGSLFEEMYAKSMSEKVPTAFEAHSIVVDRWADIHVYPADEGISIYFSDITERKKAEESLKDRTAELEAINRELENFSYTVAHDLRAPLRAIDGFSLMLEKRCLDAEADVKRKIRVIRDNVRNMGKLIDGLLAFSGLGRRLLTFSSVDMDELVHETWMEQCAANPGRRMELRSSGLFDAFGDRTLIRQVLANLFSNAVKFTILKDLAVVEVGRMDEGDETIYFVRDNGIGFDMRYQDKLFGVFQRLHSADDFEGTGVGLALVQRIINRHGGRIWAESVVGKGSTFYFTLPLVHAS